MKTRMITALALLSAALPFDSRAQITISFDYTYDTQNFFSGANIGRRVYLDAAANALQSRLADTLLAITPGGGNSWSAVFTHPGTATQTSAANLNVSANTLVIFAGGTQLGTTTLGIGGPGGFSASGTQSWIDTINARGESGISPTQPDTDFAPWGGSITFDIDANWHFDNDLSTTGDLGGTQNDFYSVALHELGHALGIGLADSWLNLSIGGNFTGSVSTNLHGGLVPLQSGDGHFASGVSSTLPGTATGQEVSMDPDLTVGTRKFFTDLDFGGLDDLGWEVVPVPEPGAFAAVTGLGLLGFALYRRRQNLRA